MRFLYPVLVVISAAAADDGIRVERSGEALIVRSPPDKANFLFRAPGAFEAKEAAEGFCVDLRAKKARIRVRITTISSADARKSIARLARDRHGEETAYLGDTGRGVATTREKVRVLMVRDGVRLYEVILEDPAGAHGDSFKELIDGFTILDPKGAPEIRLPSSTDLKPKSLEHGFYRLKLLKPYGFRAEEGDPNTDKGIWMVMRREDEMRNTCVIKVRHFLARALKKPLGGRAEAKRRAFEKKYRSARVPKRPRKFRFRGATAAYRLKMAGRLSSGIVITEDYRFVRHENDRIYEFQVTTYAGAEREFRKEIAAFWKSIRIRGK